MSSTELDTHQSAPSLPSRAALKRPQPKASPRHTYIPKIDVIVRAQSIRHNLHQQYSPASVTYASFHAGSRIKGTQYDEKEPLSPAVRSASHMTHEEKYPPSTPTSGVSSVYEKTPYTTDVHELSVDQLEARFRSDVENGLDEEYSRHLLATHGLNELTPPEKQSEVVRWVLHCFAGAFNILLWVACAGQVGLYVVFPESRDKLDLIVPAILAFVIVCAGTFQWYQERHAEQIMESFSKFIPQSVVVVRNGRQQEIPSYELVVGDVVLLSAGQKVPADVRVLQASTDLKVNNSSLTGESQPQTRSTECTSKNPLQTENLAFFGTLVLRGRGSGMVYVTGDDTLLGKIAGLSSGESAVTEGTFAHEIEQFVGVISWIAVGIASFCMLWDMMHGAEFKETVKIAVLVLIANIPEGLRPTVTLVLTLAAKRMAKRNVLVRNLESVETLGAVSVICSDKTGTITCGQMTVSHVFLNLQLYSYQARYLRKSRSQSTHSLVRTAVLCNHAVIDSNPNNNGTIIGYPTEAALLRAALPIVGGTEELVKMREEWELVYEIPFNSDNKWHLSIFRIPPADRLQHGGNELILIIKGAPEKIVDACSKYMDKNETHPIDDGTREHILDQIALACGFGERVLCMAQAYIDPSTLGTDFVFHGDRFDNANWFVGGARGGGGELTFIGFMSLIDPPREGVREAIETCRHAGVRVVMVTGDHEATARAIAAKVGIIKGGTANNETARVVSGEQIDRAIERGKTNETVARAFWDELLRYECLVFARTNPMHKMVIVSEFQKRGMVVAVTGDGVNDAPALKQAHVGVAMGQGGTDVAREAADIVLLDDNLASIVHGIEEGRLIFDNLQKSIVYTLCSKLPQLAPVLARNFMDVPLAMTMLQVLLIDLGTDVWTGVAMAYQKRESDLMSRQPVLHRKLVHWKMIVYSYLHVGVLQMCGCFLAFTQVMYNEGHGIQTLNLIGLDTGTHFSHTPYFCYDTQCSFSEYVEPTLLYHHHLSATQQATLLQTAQTAYYASLIVMQVAAALCCTTRVLSLFEYGLFSNPWLNLCLCLELLFGALVVYTPFLQELLETQPLHPVAWFAVTPFVLLLFAVEELRKYLARGQHKHWAHSMLTW